ncbi:heavy metal translocating P-type ATPase [Flavobacterium sedimenticola]|uniref:Heavy metal translocating P-type ATPase n=1 Tax=Flavobacterium sedimenticola TaxID=3043286 RepID=A0ABT6XSX0_9FLAO|nr:heavy metal translocating P-type ATPase [Flavobacterium sedimenticola]MDI9258171.1 heavy metal translocating P-type ATPase [Flavobacterium sedimenticola]
METTVKTIKVGLENVHSEHCALIVDNAIDKLEGVVGHQVELNNSLAKIELDESKFKYAVLVSTIKDLGYQVTTLKKNYPITGMTCASCAVSVESILSFEPGVIKAEVNYANSTASIEFLPGVAKPENFKKAIQSIGYDILIDKNLDTQQEVENQKNNHYQKLRKRTWGATLFTLPVFIIGMFFMDMPYANEIMWAFSTPVLLFYGRSFFINAWKQTKHKTANMDTLVALSTGIAYVFSVFNTLLPEFWHNRGLHAHVYFEAAAVVITFILLGKLLEEKAKGNTATALKKLIGLQPKTVTKINADKSQSEVAIDTIITGDLLLAKPGEKIAVDGKVIAGNSYVDESMISGEPVPVLKSEGEMVYAGTINQKGSLHYTAVKIGSDTLLAQIINMVQNAQGSKAPVQKLVDKVAGFFVPVVIGFALLTFLAWIVLGGENGITQGLLAMVTVLVIACPCALGLATPTAIMVGVGKAAENGILIKDAESLELAKKIDLVILDKTGTITEGKPSLVNQYWEQETPILKDILFSIESHSQHPLANAIVKGFSQGKMQVVSDFHEITGLGVKAVVNEHTYFIGNKKLMRMNSLDFSEAIEKFTAQEETKSHTIIYFANENQVIAALAVADKIKASSVEAIAQLQAMGIETIMLTGDHENTAVTVAKAVGIKHFLSGVMPEEKLNVVKAWQEKGKIVAMVGDGINDSAALAQANVSIAMGKGSDIAMDVAHMTIINSDLTKVSQAIMVSKQTVKTIHQNLFWAFIYNIIGIPIAAGILYPINGFLLNPMIAGAAMALSSVSVVANSLWLKLKK